MCGIAGIWGINSPAAARRMVSAISHRGPDGQGFECFQDPPATLAHTRLSIIDLRDTGRQPMSNEDDTIWITFNGEIYNFPELRDELSSRGHQFKSRTDTETLVHGYEEWGLESLIGRLNGIFAFALVDRSKSELHLVRDRLGVKPLYFCEFDNNLIFASEIKALVCFQEVPLEVNEEALLAMANYRYCPEPLTLVKGIRKLPPGHFLTINREGKTREKQYYCCEYIESDAVSPEALQEVVHEAVNRQLIADVEVGCFLSGGVDSGALLAHAMRNSDRTFRTFTIGFRAEDHKDEGQPDDLIYARKVAKYFGCDHHEIILDPSIVDSLPQVVWHLDEPIADPAAISSMLICREARKHGLKVLLSGQGGDELFCGYPWHLGAHLATTYRWIPGSLRNGLEKLANFAPAGGRGSLAGPLRRLRKFSASASKSFDDCILGFLSYAKDEDLRALFGDKYPRLSENGQPHLLHRRLLNESSSLHYINRLLHLDMNTFLPSLNLTYTDKTSMANGVEVRVPLIDNEIVEFMNQRPVDQKLRGWTTKYLLKKSLEGLLPHDVIYRKKGGFGAPIRSWVRRDLKEMIHDLLSDRQIRNRGFFEPKAVQSLILQNENGLQDFSYLIYFFLSFEIWCRQFLDQGERTSLYTA
jgi:asparagine synthase (glutamine-hydrolysing)